MKERQRVRDKDRGQLKEREKRKKRASDRDGVKGWSRESKRIEERVLE